MNSASRGRNMYVAGGKENDADDGFQLQGEISRTWTIAESKTIPT